MPEAEIAPRNPSRMGKLRLRLRNELVHRRRQLGLDRRDAGRLSWVFVATLPNSGSTALAELLLSASRSVSLRYKAEGQWLLPEMSGAATRWRPETKIDLARVRNVWIDNALGRGEGEILVVEKSPPNLIRFRALCAAFDGFGTYRLRLSRDPYAVCASWAKRYSGRRLARQWHPELAQLLERPDTYHRALGKICGQRMQMLMELDDITDADIRYEDLTSDPKATAMRLARAVPLLADIDPDARISVKDYAPQQISDMNTAQIGSLAPGQIDELTRGLEPYRAAVERFGYALR